MHIESSPFLHQDERRPKIEYAGNAARERMAFDKFKAIWILEQLRYKQWVKQGKVGAVMQKIGDIGRAGGWPFWLIWLAYTSWVIARIV